MGTYERALVAILEMKLNSENGGIRKSDGSTSSRACVFVSSSI